MLLHWRRVAVREIGSSHAPATSDGAGVIIQYNVITTHTLYRHTGGVNRYHMKYTARCFAIKLDGLGGEGG